MYVDNEVNTFCDVNKIEIDGFAVNVDEYTFYLDPTQDNDKHDVFIRGGKDEWIDVTAYDVDGTFLWKMTVSDVNILNDDEFTFITEDSRISSFYLEEGLKIVIRERD